MYQGKVLSLVCRKEFLFRSEAAKDFASSQPILLHRIRSPLHHFRSYTKDSEQKMPFHFTNLKILFYQMLIEIFFRVVH